jgi:rod shape-determining protein MreB
VFKTALARSTADLAIDLGTSNTRIALRAKGVVLDQPSVVATQDSARGHEVVAVGQDARRMLGRTPAGTHVVRPVRQGVVRDFQATEQLVRHLIKRLGLRSLVRPRVLVCVPSNITEVERRAVQESVRAAGAREVKTVSTALAGAVGAGLPISEPVGNMIIDIGGGRVEVAVISLGALVVHRSVPTAGDAMDESISRWMREQRDLLIGERTAEQLKTRIGSAHAIENPEKMRIRGRDLQNGSPRELDVSSNDLASAMEPTVARIRDTVLEVLRETPPELAADIVERGVLVCGGAAQLLGMTDMLRDTTGLPVLLAESPTTCVVQGAAMMLEDQAMFDRCVE